jgi:hypothetical protein
MTTSSIDGRAEDGRVVLERYPALVGLTPVQTGQNGPMADDQDRIKARAEALLPEEEEAGSDDPEAQAAAILEESDEREFERDDPTGQGLERRTSADTVDMPDLSDAAGPTETSGDQEPKP